MAWVEKNGRYWRVRYYADDGTVASMSDRYSQERAEDIAEEINVDQRRGEFIDPRTGSTLLEEWAADWFASIDVAESTEAKYTSYYDAHIEPEWGSEALADISTMAVRKWEKRLRRKYQASTVDGIMQVLRMMLEDALEERLIFTNPARARRRGRRQQPPRQERVWATPAQALAVADAAGAHAGTWARILILTAAWTGMRWGELAGLQWKNVHLLAEQPYLYVHPEHGSLKEVSGRLYLGPPKSEAGGRSVVLPPLLVDELALHQASQAGPFVFVSPDGAWLRRGNFRRRVLRPICDGREAQPPRRGRGAVAELPAIAPRLTMHGFKHSHNTWMLEMGLPDVARYKRLGWHIADAVQRTYSHVSDDVERRLIDGLQQRYEEAAREAGRSAADRGGVGDGGGKRAAEIPENPQPRNV